MFSKKGDKKIGVEVVEISQPEGYPKGVYLLLLKERKKRGKNTEDLRKMSIVVGASEAQAIYLALEQQETERPLTHRLFFNVAQDFSIQLEEVCIYKLEENTFHALMHFSQGGSSKDIDARTSDAIALALRFGCPIYCRESVLEKVAKTLLADKNEERKQLGDGEKETKASQLGLLSLLIKDSDISGVEEKGEENSSSEEMGLKKASTRELKRNLERAVEDELYEMAAKIRDELNRRKSPPL